MKTIQEESQVEIKQTEVDDGTYRSMYLVDVTVLLPEIKIPEIPTVSIASIVTEFSNSNRN